MAGMIATVSFYVFTIVYYIWVYKVSVYARTYVLPKALCMMYEILSDSYIRYDVLCGASLYMMYYIIIATD